MKKLLRNGPVLAGSIGEGSELKGMPFGLPVDLRNPVERTHSLLHNYWC